MKNGFSLLELIVAIAIVSVLSTFGFAAYRAMLFRSDFDTTKIAITQGLSEAQQYARHSYKDDSWGMFIEPSRLTIFKGDDYGTRDTNEDLVRSFPVTINVSGTTTYYFEKAQGSLSTLSTTTISYQQISSSIHVNTMGRIYD